MFHEDNRDKNRQKYSEIANKEDVNIVCGIAVNIIPFSTNIFAHDNCRRFSVKTGTYSSQTYVYVSDAMAKLFKTRYFAMASHFVMLSLAY